MTQEHDRLHIAVRIVLVQIAMAITIVGLMFAVKGWIAGYSVMLGAITGIVPTAVSSLIAFKLKSQDAGAILATLYSGALIKYLLTAVLFGLILVFIKPIEPVMLLVGLIATQLAMVFAPLLRK